ncbi:MAG TPA: F0F1 ATP synthase subunit A [Candidatus Kapabacteria bacterium]|jgi:F-type H+-transporting ATPase subunit a
MAATDTILTQTPANASATAIPQGAAKPNYFNEGFRELGNHHTVDFMPFGELPLPYIFFDHGSLHVYASVESLKESGVYTTNVDPKFDPQQLIGTSPLTEKGAALRIDGKPIGLDLSITSNLFFLGFAGVLLAILGAIAASRAKKSLIPSGLRNLFEVLIIFVRDDIVAPNIAEPYGSRLLPYFLTIFFFILLANLTGLLPWAHTPTSSVEVTAALAICTFVITQVIGIWTMGIKTFLLHLTAGLHEMELSIVMKALLLAIMVPIEFMGIFTKPFALCIRLFANMTAGHIIIISLICLALLFHSIIIGFFVTVPFAIFVYLLEIFVATLQAYIFTILSALFIGMMAHSAHDEHVHDHDLPHAPDGDHLVATSHG